MQEGNILNRTPDYNFLNQVIDNIKNIEKKDMMMIVKEIYDATYFKYSMLFYKAEGERDRMRDVVIQKTEKIDKLQGLCASLLDVIENGNKVSTEDLLTLRQMYEDNKEDEAFTTRTPSKIIS